MAVWIASALLTLALATSVARAADVVPAERAADVVGSTVTIEGDVAVARLESDALILELAPAGEKSFRAVLVLALISSLPRQPERVYEGKRIRVTGKVQRFRGRPEMILESPDMIEIVDLAGAPAAAEPNTTAATPTTAVPGTTIARPAEPTTVVPPPEVEREAAPSAPPPVPVAIAPTLAAPPASPPAVAAAPAPAPPEPVTAPQLLADKIRTDACERARAKWDDAASRIRTASAALTRCLDGGSHRCRQEATALAPAVADLEWAEQNLADRCE